MYIINFCLDNLDTSWTDSSFWSILVDPHGVRNSEVCLSSLCNEVNLICRLYIVATEILVRALGVSSSSAKEQSAAQLRISLRRTSEHQIFRRSFTEQIPPPSFN